MPGLVSNLIVGILQKRYVAAFFGVFGVLAQGVCRAGKMLGLEDQRSCLIREVYRVFDHLESAYLTEKI